MRDPYHVPIEHRWLGLDRRALPYAAVMVGVIALLVYVIPAINGAVAWDDETRAGDVLDLGAGLTVTPPVGWLLESGIRTNDEAATPVQASSAGAEIASGGINILVTASGWDGTADELLDQANRLRADSGADENRLFEVTGARSTVTSASGITGVSETFTSASGDGMSIAFAVPGGPAGAPASGVTFTISASADNLARYGGAIDDMVASLVRTEQATS